MKNKLRDVLLVVIAVLLALNLAVQFTGGVGTAKAGGSKYKMASTAPLKNMQDFEKMLNEMSDQGWEYVEFMGQGNAVVFKK